MENSQSKIKSAVPRPHRKFPETQPEHEANLLRRPRRMMPRRRQPRLPLPTMEYRLVSLFAE